MSAFLDRIRLEAVVVDDSKRYDEFCRGMVESMTEFDWEGGQYELSEHLRQGLRDWAKELFEWDLDRRREQS